MSLPPSSAPTATGWSDSCRAGFAPAVGRRLRTAHEKSGLAAQTLVHRVLLPDPRYLRVRHRSTLPPGSRRVALHLSREETSIHSNGSMGFGVSFLRHLSQLSKSSSLCNSYHSNTCRKARLGNRPSTTPVAMCTTISYSPYFAPPLRPETAPRVQPPGLRRSGPPPSSPLRPCRGNGDSPPESRASSCKYFHRRAGRHLATPVRLVSPSCLIKPELLDVLIQVFVQRIDQRSCQFSLLFRTQLI